MIGFRGLLQLYYSVSSHESEKNLFIKPSKILTFNPVPFMIFSIPATISKTGKVCVERVILENPPPRFRTDAKLFGMNSPKKRYSVKKNTVASSAVKTVNI